MSIQNEGRQHQLEQREEKRRKEAEARPDPMHRAIVFLLHAAKENNPDIAEEAKHHLATLDSEAGSPAVEEATPAAAASFAPPSAAPAPAATEPASASAPPKQSRRFKRS